MKRAILDAEEEHRCTSTGTPPSSTIRRALPGLKERFQSAPAAVSWTSWKEKVITYTGQIQKELATIRHALLSQRTVGRYLRLPFPLLDVLKIMINICLIEVPCVAHSHLTTFLKPQQKLEKE